MYHVLQGTVSSAGETSTGQTVHHCNQVMLLGKHWYETGKVGKCISHVIFYLQYCLIHHNELCVHMDIYPTMLVLNYTMIKYIIILYYDKAYAAWCQSFYLGEGWSGWDLPFDFTPWRRTFSWLLDVSLLNNMESNEGLRDDRGWDDAIPDIDDLALLGFFKISIALEPFSISSCIWI